MPTATANPPRAAMHEPPAPTPLPVRFAIDKLAEFLAERGYGGAIVAPNGGVIFRNDDIVTREQELLAIAARAAEPDPDAELRALIAGVNLTPRQVEVLEFIHHFRLSAQVSPTLQEIADALGVSRVTVFEYVNALCGKGVLKRDGKHRARCLSIVRRAAK